MGRYEKLFNKVIDGVESCNEADGYSECQYCPYYNECKDAGELYPGIRTGSPLLHDIERLRMIMRRLDEIGGMK